MQVRHSLARLFTRFVITFMALVTAPSFAGAGQEAARRPVDLTGPASTEERQALIDALVAKWGPYIEATYGASVDAWRERLAAGFTQADATNLREAVRRETYEGAMAALVGRGQRINDALPFADARGTVQTTGSAGLRLGDIAADLTFTPVQPCRIADTRSAVAGVIAAGTVRNFYGIGVSSYTIQGGSATDCGLMSQTATAIAINVTAVAPAAGGYATIYPYNTTRPLTASLNYAAGDIINNSVIAQIPNPLQSFDFSLYSFAQSHYVVDIVGYFAPNQVTALQCVDTAVDEATMANGQQLGVVAPSCPTGYIETATYCETSSGDAPLAYVRSGTCIAKNTSGSSQVIRALRRCCRVPGR